MEVYRRFRFHAARHLPNLDDNHICKQIHGHTFNITVYVNGEIDKKTGFLVREGNSEDIMKKLKQLLNDPNLAQQMGKEGRKFVSSQFNWEFVTKNFLEIIKPYLKN